jgi:hypothetical protein
MHIPPVGPIRGTQNSAEDPQLVQLVNQCWLDIRWMMDNYGGSDQPSSPPLAVVESAMNSLQGLITYLQNMPASSLTAADQKLLSAAQAVSNMLGTNPAVVKENYVIYEGAFSGLLSLMDPGNSPYPMNNVDAGNLTIMADLDLFRQDLADYNAISAGNSPDKQQMLNIVLQRIADDIQTLDGALKNVTDGPLLSLKNLLEVSIQGGKGLSLLQMAQKGELANLQNVFNQPGSTFGFGEGVDGGGQLTIFLTDVNYWEYNAGN